MYRPLAMTPGRHAAGPLTMLTMTNTVLPVSKG
jgi:hypothetical protein